MINVSNLEERLVANLQTFRTESCETLNNIATGMELAHKLLDSPEESTKISDIAGKLVVVSEILSNFRIGIDTTTNPEKLWLVWDKTGSQTKYYYNDDKELTEKMLCFVLMSFEKEISQRLSIIEEPFNGYIYSCTKIKDGLHRIISEYMTA